VPTIILRAAARGPVPLCARLRQRQPAPFALQENDHVEFLARLFGAADRVESASAHLALAVEGIASDLESVRAALRERLGLDSLPAVPALSAPEDNAAGRKRGKPSAA
jgi:hypothetical protein